MSKTDPEVVRSTSNKDDKGNSNRTFGDVCNPKEKGIVGIIFQNINGFGYGYNSVKNLIHKHNVDIMAMAEMNLNWGKLSRNHTLAQVCKKWFQTSKSVVAYNQHERKKKFKHQPGGTATITTGEMALRVNSNSYDSKRMGRWLS